MAVTELHLQDHLTRLSLTPDLGASLINWQVKATGQALLRHSDPAALASGTPRQLACYPLAPWSNRIAEGASHGPRAGWPCRPTPPTTLTRFMAAPGSRPGMWTTTASAAPGCLSTVRCHLPTGRRWMYTCMRVA